MEFIAGDRCSKWLSELKSRWPSIGGTESFSPKSKVGDVPETVPSYGSLSKGLSVQLGL